MLLVKTQNYDNNKTMADIIREKMHLVMNGNGQLVEFLFHVHKTNYVNEILCWFINRNLIGKNLLKYINERHMGNYSNVINFVKQNIKNEIN